VSSSATTVALAEPLTTLVRSAHSRVSLVAPLDVACEDTLTSLDRGRNCSGAKRRTPSTTMRASDGGSPVPL
jgi:hypothetical protein